MSSFAHRLAALATGRFGASPRAHPAPGAQRDAPDPVEIVELADRPSQSPRNAAPAEASHRIFQPSAPALPQAEMPVPSPDLPRRAAPAFEPQADQRLPAPAVPPHAPELQIPLPKADFAPRPPAAPPVRTDGAPEGATFETARPTAPDAAAPVPPFTLSLSAVTAPPRPGLPLTAWAQHADPLQPGAAAAVAPAAPEPGPPPAMRDVSAAPVAAPAPAGLSIGEMRLTVTPPPPSSPPPAPAPRGGLSTSALMRRAGVRRL